MKKSIREKVKIRNLKDGAIIWHGQAFWIKGYTLPEKYLDNYCYKIGRNLYDYELLLGERKNGRK